MLSLTRGLIKIFLLFRSILYLLYDNCSINDVWSTNKCLVSEFGELQEVFSYLQGITEYIVYVVLSFWFIRLAMLQIWEAIYQFTSTVSMPSIGYLQNRILIVCGCILVESALNKACPFSVLSSSSPSAMFVVEVKRSSYELFC